MKHAKTIARSAFDQVFLIIHADDAGMSHSVNAATIAAMENGIVTSASILVPAPQFSEIAAYARMHSKRDFGVHLAITSEWSKHRWGPISHPRQVESLVDESGSFWQTVSEAARNARAEHAEIELIAQIERAMAAGVPITHLDTHQGALLSRPDLAEVYLSLAIRFSLPILVDEAHLQDAIIGPTLSEGIDRLRTVLNFDRVPVLSLVTQFYEGGTNEQRKDRYLEILRSLKPGVSQVIVHCGFDDVELKAITGQSALRESDYRLMLNPELRVEVDRQGIKLTKWKEFSTLKVFVESEQF